MQISIDQLSKHLQRGVQALYTVYGEETLLALEAIDLIRRTARDSGFTEREILIVEAGFDWARLNDSARSLSLFSSKRVLELRVPSGKPGIEGSSAVQAFCGNLPTDTVTIVYLPKLDKQTTNSKWFTALADAGVTINANAIDRRQLPQWINERLKRQDQSADSEALHFLVDRIEGNLVAAYQEIQKLGLIYPPGNLSFEQVKDAVLNVARYDVFKLGEALLLGDQAQFVRMLNGLRAEGVAPPLILWAITEEARVLYKISNKMRSGAPLAQAMREARVWGARQNLLPNAIKRLSIEALKNTLSHAAQIDRTIKGLQAGNIWDELLLLALRLMPRDITSPGNRGKIRISAQASV